MRPFLTENYGNPSAGYRFGKESRKAVETAREQVANLIGAEPSEIIFTSCGTESTNTAIGSALRSYPNKLRIVTSTVEHSATVETCRDLEAQGVEIGRAGVDQNGFLDLEAFREALKQPPAALASVIWANNETGVLTPVSEAAEIAAESGVMFHADAVQAVGKIEVDVRTLPIAMLSISGHKIHAPKGVGALFVNRNVRFHPLLFGGGQENERRSGTENLASIVGLGKAAEIAKAATPDLRDRFEKTVCERIPGVEVNGNRENRLPNTSNLHFPDVDAEAMLILLDERGICCSPGSACSTGSKHGSAVLTAMGFSETRSKSSLRFSFSQFNTEMEIDEAVEKIVESVTRIREVMPKSAGPVALT